MTKQEVIAMIESLPDDVTTDGILYELYVRTSIEAGFADIEAGRTVSHEEVKRMVENWLFPKRKPEALSSDA